MHKICFFAETWHFRKRRQITDYVWDLIFGQHATKFDTHRMRLQKIDKCMVQKEAETEI